jgi:hypothetical protein
MLEGKDFMVFLNASAKSRKASITVVMFVCLFVRTEQLGSHWK